MSIRLLVYLISTVLVLITGILVFLNNKKNTTNRFYLLFTLATTVWMLSLAIADNSSNLAAVEFASKLAFGSSIFAIQSLFLLALVFPTSNKFPHKKLAFASLIPTIGLMSLSFTHYSVESVAIKSFGADVKGGIGYSIFFIYFLLYFGATLFILIAKMKKAKGKEKQQINFFILGLSISLILVFITNLVLVLFNISELGYLGPPSLLIFIGLTAYAIIRHKLFDIRFVVVRALTYLLSITLLASVYAVIAFRIANIFLGDASAGVQQVFYVFLAIVLALTYAPLFRFFSRATNKIFYRDRYDAQILADKIGQILASEIDLDKLSTKVLRELTSQMKIEKAEIVVFGDKQLFYENNVFTKNGESVSRSELRKLGRVVNVADNLQAGEPKSLMSHYDISVSLALKTSEKFIGYLLLSEKKSGEIFNDEDLRVLNIIGSELSVAVQNALSYREIQLFSETLAQKVRERTAQLKTANEQLRLLDEAKDEFISMASHQLRTPLTTVKGYASMLEEGDFGKLNPQQQEPVQLALDGANRMARLIDDLLNVSRMDANRFFLEVTKVDVTKLVKQEIDQLQTMAANKHVVVTYTPPKEAIEPIRLDETKTRQVVMNLVDNAIHYSQPPSGGAKVQVSLRQENNEIVFEVKDNGIGVPAAVQKRLFTKMFRANNAKTVRPDGTGLGLYLVKRVVHDEGGRLIFESTEGKGSTFGFYLPLSGVPKNIEEQSKKISARVTAHPKA